MGGVGGRLQGEERLVVQGGSPASPWPAGWRGSKAGGLLSQQASAGSAAGRPAEPQPAYLQLIFPLKHHQPCPLGRLYAAQQRVAQAWV